MDGSMKKHTIGPWRHIRQRATDDSHDVMAGAGVALCVATCGKQACDDGVIAANARLIAAAPDLLAACQMALEHICAGTDVDEIQETLQDAITKATGGMEHD